MSKFKVGERVCVYFGERYFGEVIMCLSNQRYEINVDHGNGTGAVFTVHEKKIRRLVKKKKKEKLGRELWFFCDDYELGFRVQEYKPLGTWKQVIHVREILE